MAKKIVTASGKGGVGKSTAAAALGMILSENGLKALIVDCDAGLGSIDVLLGKAQEAAFNWLDVYNGNCDPGGAAVKINDCLSILCAPPSRPESIDEKSVKDVISAIEDSFDYILIDAPAGLGEGLRRAALAADNAVIIATADEVSVRGADRADAVLRDLGIDETRLLINRYSVKDAKKGKLLGIDEVIDKTFVRLLGVIPEDKEISYYSVTGEISRRSKGAAAFRRVADRIQGKNVRLTLSLIK